MSEVNSRMTIAGRAADFMMTLDVKRQELEQHANEQVERVSVIIMDLNKTKEDVKDVFKNIEAKVAEIDQKLLTVPELTQKLDEKTEQIDTLFKETQRFAVKSEQDLIVLNQKTADFATKITGDLGGAPRRDDQAEG